MRCSVAVAMGSATMALACLGSGCAMLPAKMPAGYFSPKRSLEIAIENKLAGPELRSEHGGMVSGVMWLTRVKHMKENLAGIDPARTPELLLGNLRAELAPTFDVKDAAAQLRLKIILSNWGWRLKAATAGLKQDDYQLYLMGTAEIWDLQSNRRIYNGYIGPEISIGWVPTVEASQAAYPEVVRKFAADLHRYILLGKGK